MSFFGKTYTYEKHENFDKWLKAVGTPDDKIPVIVSLKPGQKFDKNGDSYTFTQYSPRGEKVITFKSGVEFDDTIGEENIPIKTTYTVDGNTITQVMNGSRGKTTFKREFNGDELVVTITGDKFDGVAKRYYKA